MVRLVPPLACAFVLGASCCEGRLGAPQGELAESRPKPEADVYKRLSEVTAKELLTWMGLTLLNRTTAPARKVVAEIQETQDKLGAFARKADNTFKALKTLSQSALDNFQTSEATAELRASLNEAQRKLGVNSTRELFGRFEEAVLKHQQEAEAARANNGVAQLSESLPARVNAANSGVAQLSESLPARVNASAVMSFLRRGAESSAVSSRVREIQNSSSFKALKTTVNLGKNLITWVNDTKAGKHEVGETFLELLHSVPEREGSVIKNKALPFIAANSLLRGMPLSKSEKAMINLGLLMGVTLSDQSNKSVYEAGYENGQVALKRLKQVGVRY